MNRLIIILAFIFILLADRNIANAESFRVDVSYMFQSGEDYSKYKDIFLQDIENFQTDYLVDMKVIDNFEMTMAPKFTLYLTHENGFEVGATISAYGTGGLIAYSDYSGFIRKEVSLNTNQFGLMLRKNLNKSYIDSRVTLKLGLNFNYLTTESKSIQTINILGEENEISEIRDEDVFVVEPSVVLLYDLDYIQIGYSLSYTLELAQNYLYRLNRNGFYHGAVISLGF